MIQEIALTGSLNKKRKESIKMFDKNEKYAKPVFEETEIVLYLTAGQEKLMRRQGKIVREIDGVELYLATWNGASSWIKFLAPKLTEILTTLRGIDINAVPDYDRTSVKSNITRLIKALELRVTEVWGNRKYSYARQIKELRDYAEGQTTAYTLELEKGQYGFVWTTKSDSGYWGCGKVTIAPVPFISLDGTPTIEWVCDNEGFYLSMGSGNRRESNTERYGTLETALERGKAMCQALIDQATKAELQNRQEAIAKLAELEVDAFIKVQAIA